MDSKLDRLRLKKEVWEKAVDTQMHFNEMSVKSRQLGLTFVVAALGLAAILLSRGQGFGIEVWGGYVHVSSLIVLIAALGVFAVRILDLNVYHKMLRGAVLFGEKLEQEMHSDGLYRVPRGMTESISMQSRYEKVCNSTMEGVVKTKTAGDKIASFYNITIVVLLCIALAIVVVFWNVRNDVLSKLATPVKGEQSGSLEVKTSNKVEKTPTYVPRNTVPK